MSYDEDEFKSMGDDEDMPLDEDMSMSDADFGLDEEDPDKDG